MEHSTSSTAIVKEFTHRIWDEKDWSVIDELLGENIVIHSSLGEFQGREHMRQVLQSWLTAFSDLVQDRVLISERDLVVSHWRGHGTHSGLFKGRQPTGKRVDYAGATIYRVAQGKIVEYWAYLDMHHLLEQLSIP